MEQPWDIRDEMHHEVHNMNPSWIMKWGITMVTFFLLVLFLVSYIIKYPDVITAEARLVSDVPAVTIPATMNTKISELAVDDQQQVNSGDYLLVFQNNSSHRDVARLKEHLIRLADETNWNEFFKEATNQNYQLGEIQEHYDILLEHLLEYFQITDQEKYDREIARLNRELRLHNHLGSRLSNIVHTNENVEDILTRNIQRDSLLFFSSMISEKDYSHRKQTYLESKKLLTQEQLSADRNQLDATRLSNAIANLRQVKQEKLLSLKVKVDESTTRLRSTIDVWETRYVMKAPNAGIVHFLLPIKQDQYVTAGESLLVVMPQTKGYSATVRIPFDGAGKIEPGQRVHIKLNDYPHNEYGVLTGTIARLSNVAGKDHYLGQVQLDNYGKTTYGKEIVIRENTVGAAEIITQDRSWLARVFEKIIYVFRK